MSVNGKDAFELSDEERKRREVLGILVRLQRYVRGYLRYFRVEADEDFSKNPAVVTIKVWWKDDENFSNMEKEN